MNTLQTAEPAKDMDQDVKSDVLVQGLKAKKLAGLSKPETPVAVVAQGEKTEAADAEAAASADETIKFAGAVQPTASGNDFANRQAPVKAAATSNAEVKTGEVAPTGNDLRMGRAVQGKPSTGKAKVQGADRTSSAGQSDDTEQSATTSSAVVANPAQAAAPQTATGTHPQMHSGLSSVEAPKSSAVIAGSVDGARNVQAAVASSTTFTTAQAVQLGGDQGARNQQVEIGFHDGTLGWLSVRAAAASDNGGLHLSVTGRSTEAAAAVDRMLPSLQHFLQEHDIRAHSVTYGSQQNAALPVASGNMASSSFSQDTRNASSGDQRSSSSGQERSGSGSEQQTFTQRDRNNQPRAFQVSAGARYESSLQEHGLLSIRI